jgi:hypothetical protein
MGGEMGENGGSTINTGREAYQFVGGLFANPGAMASDIRIGNRGAQMGQYIANNGPRDVSTAWVECMVRYR